MVVEVLALIRKLARAGMTMLIAAHEMRFARAVSTRVLYMDEGGIYEDGTPEQIFEHPLREKTRQFVRRLRSLPFTIDSAGAFDSLGALSEIERFSLEMELHPKVVSHLQLLFEETIVGNIVPHVDAQGVGFPIRCAIEHAEANGETVFSVTYGGDGFNPLKDADDLSGKTDPRHPRQERIHVWHRQPPRADAVGSPLKGR